MKNRIQPKDWSLPLTLTPTKITRRRRRLRLAVMSVLCLVAMTGLTVLTILDTLKASANALKTKTLQSSVRLSIEVAGLIHELQIERGTRVLHVSSGRDHSVWQKVLEAGNNTDHLAKNLEKWPEAELDKYNFNSLETFMALVNNHRISHTVDNSTVQDEIIFYSEIILNLFDWFFRNVQQLDHDVLSEFIGYQMLLIGKEKTGIERALGGSFFIRGQFSETKELLWFAENNVLGKENLNSSMQLMPEIKNIYKKAVESHNSSVLNEVEQRRNIILSNKKQNASAESGKKWFHLMTAYIDALLQVQREAGNLILERLKNDVTTTENDWILKLAIFGFIVLLMPFFVYVISMIQGFAAKLHQTTNLLKEEKERADFLLYQMLPYPVVEQLKSGHPVTAEQFESVTVFFSDIVDFTEICANISPMEVTQMLNRLYGIFDNHIDKYDVYKVETIGDAYMVVSGLPEKNGHRHVTEIALMALHLVELMESFRFGSEGDQDLCVRIGIHTGKLGWQLNISVVT